MNFGTDFKITLVADTAASAGTEVVGATLDMSGFEGVCFFSTIDTANAGNYMKAQQGQASGMGDAADLAGTRVNSSTSDEDVILNVHKPLERYVRCSIIRAGANSRTGEIWAIQYGARNVPKDNSLSGTSKAVVVVSPAEGTP